MKFKIIYRHMSNLCFCKFYVYIFLFAQVNSRVAHTKETAALNLFLPEGKTRIIRSKTPSTEAYQGISGLPLGI